MIAVIVTGIATTKQPRDGDGQPPYAPAHLLRMNDAFVAAMRSAHPDRETATAPLHHERRNPTGDADTQHAGPCCDCLCPPS
jgi:hypothetical protein